MCHEGRGRDLVLPVSLAEVGEVPDGLVVRTPDFHCHDPGSVPEKATEILPAMRYGHQQQQNKIKKKFFFADM